MREKVSHQKYSGREVYWAVTVPGVTVRYCRTRWIPYILSSLWVPPHITKVFSACRFYSVNIIHLFKWIKYLNRFHFMFLNLIFHKFKTFALNIWFSEMRGPVWDFQTTSKDCRKIGLGNGGIQLNLLKLTLILNNRWQLFKYSTKTPVCAPPSSILPGQVFSSDFSFLLPQTHSTLSLPTQNRQKI